MMTELITSNVSSNVLRQYVASMLEENNKHNPYSGPVKIELDKLLMIVQVESAGFDGGNFAQIKINNVPVDVKPNNNNHYRGLHIVVINKSNCTVVFSRVFDTYLTCQGFKEFDEFIKFDI